MRKVHVVPAFFLNKSSIAGLMADSMLPRLDVTPDFDYDKERMP
jgi:hypothetical protein